MSVPCSATISFWLYIGNKECLTLRGVAGKVGSVRMGVIEAALICSCLHIH